MCVWGYDLYLLVQSAAYSVGSWKALNTALFSFCSMIQGVQDSTEKDDQEEGWNTYKQPTKFAED